MSGKKGRSGRKPAAATLERLSLEENEAHVPEYLAALAEIAEDPGVPKNIRILAYKERLNRGLGTPRAAIDLRFTRQVGLTAADIRKCVDLRILVYARQASLIESLGMSVPESLSERNSLVSVENIEINLDSNSVAVDFNISGNIQREVL